VGQEFVGLDLSQAKMAVDAGPSLGVARPARVGPERDSNVANPVILPVAGL
jgi:hypothetical protein